MNIGIGLFLKMNKGEVKKQLGMLYTMRCMLTDSESNINYHHTFIKKCDGGGVTVNNGTLLCRIIHSYLHSLENGNIEQYRELNEALQCYKVCVEWNEVIGLEIWEDVKQQIKNKVR